MLVFPRFFQGCFQGCFQGYLDRVSKVYTFHSFMILTSPIFLANLSACHAKTNVAQMQFKNLGRHNKQKLKTILLKISLREYSFITNKHNQKLINILENQKIYRSIILLKDNTLYYFIVFFPGQDEKLLHYVKIKGLTILNHLNTRCK